MQHNTSTDRVLKIAGVGRADNPCRAWPRRSADTAPKRKGLVAGCQLTVMEGVQRAAPGQRLLDT